MKIIFAQGNPGTTYNGTRHNVGFSLIDTLAKAHSTSFASKPKFQADIAEFSVDGEKVLLIKPTTFYNETGQSARAIIDFYKLTPSTDFLVIHDELALPFGTIRTRLSGSDAGNNGIKSLNAHLGQEHSRIKVGVYTPLRDKMHDATFVLSKFTEEESKKLPAIAEQVQSFAESFIRGELQPHKVAL